MTDARVLCIVVNVEEQIIVGLAEILSCSPIRPSSHWQSDALFLKHLQTLGWNMHCDMKLIMTERTLKEEGVWQCSVNGPKCVRRKTSTLCHLKWFNAIGKMRRVDRYVWSGASEPNSSNAKTGIFDLLVNLSKITITEYFMKQLPENLLANKILFDLKC